MPEATKPMQRIVILGCSGAGKSTLARTVGEKLKLPVIHLDSLYWQPGWKEVPEDQFIQLQREKLTAPQWVVDGNYHSTLPIRIERADTIVFLDFSRSICLYRALKRRWMYRGQTRPDIGPGCPEKMDWEFISWIWNFRSRIKPHIMATLSAANSNMKIVQLHSPREVNEWLSELTRGVCNEASSG